MSKYTENVCVEKGDGKIRHLLMMGTKHIYFRGTSPAAVQAHGDKKDFSFFSNIINEKLRECSVLS